MFCIRSDVITLRSIEMYGLITVWTSMNDRPYWVILLMNMSLDMRHTGFRRLTVVNGTPGFWGVTVVQGENDYVRVFIITKYYNLYYQVNRCQKKKNLNTYLRSLRLYLIPKKMLKKRKKCYEKSFS